MKMSKEEVGSALGQFNPWWRKEPISDLPSWHRAAYQELLSWVNNPPAPRAIMLSGARQVGKTTLLLQTVQALLTSGTNPANIVYVTFDHPILKLAGIDLVLEAWKEREPSAEGPDYLFLDEVQFEPGWATWIKHQVDFSKQRRIIFTGSATPLLSSGEESGVGRWHTIPLSTLSFSEYLHLKKITHPAIPEIHALSDLWKWSPGDFMKTSEILSSFTGYFYEYLIRGGFPQTSQVESISQAQRLMREDIIDKVLKRDMTALYGVRNIIELEHLFLYLCLHDTSILDIQALSSNLGVSKPTALNFLSLLESTHLIHRLPAFGYGKEVLRAKYKVYLADPAIAPAVLLKGKSLIDDPKALSTLIETAVFKHLFTASNVAPARFSYWRDSRELEVDFIVDINSKLTPIEVKAQGDASDLRELKGLLALNKSRSIEHNYVISKTPHDFGPINNSPVPIMRIPALLFCYLSGQAELTHARLLG